MKVLLAHPRSSGLLTGHCVNVSYGGVLTCGSTAHRIAYVTHLGKEPLHGMPPSVLQYVGAMAVQKVMQCNMAASVSQYMLASMLLTVANAAARS